MKKLILASTSPRRQALLAKTGLEFTIVPSDYEEDMTLPLAPQELVMHLSRGKALAVAALHPEAVVIGADTIVAFHGGVLGKPHTENRAREMLRELSGTTHSIVTGFTVIDSTSGKAVSKAVETIIYFKKLTEQDITDYIATGESLDKAGAYALQEIGAKFIEKIEGSHDSAVGLPIAELLEVLRDFGVTLP